MRRAFVALVVALLGVACASPAARAPQSSAWIFRPGQDATTLARETEECERFIAAMIPGEKAAQERTVSNKEFAYAIVTFPASLLGGLDLTSNHAALLIKQKLRGPRPWTAEDEQTYRTHRLRACLWLRGYRDTPSADEGRR